MLVDARHPPFSPLLDDGHSKLILHSGDPVHCAGNGHTVIDISRSHPDPKTCLDELRIQPVAGVGELSVVGCNIITACFEFSEGHMELRLDRGLVEKVTDTIHIFADDTICHSWCESSMRKPVERLLFLGLGNLLEEALGIEIEHAGVGRVEFLISNLPHIFAGITLVSENAGSPNVVVLTLRVVAMIEEVFVLVDAHIHVISGLIALSGFSACVVDHNSLEVDNHLP